MSQSYSFEPELLKPAPRDVRRRAGAKKSAKGCTGCFLIPHTVVGIGLMLWLLWLAVFAVAGRTVPATIIGRDTGTSDDGPTYHLLYSYNAGGRTYEKKASVAWSDYTNLRDGSATWVKISPFAPGIGPRLQVARNNGMSLMFLVPFALFWNVFLFAVWKGALGMGGGKKLVREGIPAVGRILHKRIVSGSYGDTHYILFEWLPHGTASGAALTASGPFSSSSFGTTAFGTTPHPTAPMVSPKVTVDFKPFPPDWDDDAAAAANPPNFVPQPNAAQPNATKPFRGWREAIADAKAEVEKTKQRIAARHTPGAPSREISVELPEWNAVRVGELVTVLVDKNTASRVILYRIAGWQAT